MIETEIKCRHCKIIIERNERLLNEVMATRKNVPIGVCEHCRNVCKICCSLCTSLGSDRKENTKSCIEWLRELKCLLEQLINLHNHCSNTYRDTELERILQQIKLPLLTRNLKIEEYPNLKEARLVNRKITEDKEIIKDLLRVIMAGCDAKNLKLRHSHKQSITKFEENRLPFPLSKEYRSEISKEPKVSTKVYSYNASSKPFHNRVSPSKVSPTKDDLSDIAKQRQVLIKLYSRNASSKAIHKRVSPTKVSPTKNELSETLKERLVSIKEYSSNASSKAFHNRVSPTKDSPTKDDLSETSKERHVSIKEYSSNASSKGFNNRVSPKKASKSKDYLSETSKKRHVSIKEYSSNESEGFNNIVSHTKVCPSADDMSETSNNRKVPTKKYSSNAFSKAFNKIVFPIKFTSFKDSMSETSKGRQESKKGYFSNASSSKSFRYQAHSTKVLGTVKIGVKYINDQRKHIQNEIKSHKENTVITKELNVTPTKDYISKSLKEHQVANEGNFSNTSPSEAQANNKASSTKLLGKDNEDATDDENGQTKKVKNDQKSQTGSKTVLPISELNSKSNTSNMITCTSRRLEHNKKPTTEGGFLYQLSNKKFIDIGWTKMPTFKTIRRINIYEMESPNLETGWFEENKSKKMIYYDSGEKLARIDNDGCGTLFYRNGTVALTYNNDKDKHKGRRYTVYNGTEFEKSRNSQTELAIFDFSGNGVIYDSKGDIRMKYNQSEGVIVNPKLDPIMRWKWHTLNDPPVLREITINHHLDPVDPDIEKIGQKLELKIAQAKSVQEEIRIKSSASAKSESKTEEISENHPYFNEIMQARSDAQMKEIEMNNFIKNKLKSSFRKFKIRMKAVKINDYFSVKILEQSKILLRYRNGPTRLKFNLGLCLNGSKIVDAAFFEASDLLSVLIPYGRIDEYAERLAK